MMHCCANYISVLVQIFNLPMRSSIHRFFNSTGFRDPYDVLGLKKSCSTKDVKEAYIKLCKELHPDMKPGDTSQHKKFIELNNAYTTILNSENKKQVFDSHIHSPYMHSNPRANTSQSWESEIPWYKKKEYEEQFHQYDKKDRRKLNNTKANTVIVAGCFILIILGSALYLCAYRYATIYKMQSVDERSKKISQDYYGTRKNAIEKGRMEELDKLKRRWNT